MMFEGDHPAVDHAVVHRDVHAACVRVVLNDELKQAVRRSRYCSRMTWCCPRRWAVVTPVSTPTRRRRPWSPSASPNTCATSNTGPSDSARVCDGRCGIRRSR